MVAIGQCASQADVNAEEVKAALRRRHPTDSNVGGMPGEWVTIAEWRRVDLLALSAWRTGSVIGYEVKVSRSDFRSELLRPHKRAEAVEMTTEFYMAVPDGLLTAEEIAWEEPEWEAGDFDPPWCTNDLCYMSKQDPRSYRYSRARSYREGASVDLGHYYMREVRSDGSTYSESGRIKACCSMCRGKGKVGPSVVERTAPKLWVPRDVGLIVVKSSGCFVVKKSPRRKAPKPIAATRQQVNDLVRWTSHRPDPRHVRLTSVEVVA